MKPFIIGITGASCSGKTILALSLKGSFPDRDSLIIAMDSYYRDLGDLDPVDRAMQNFDKPDSLAFDLYIRHLTELSMGGEVLIPVYNFEEHTRAPSGEWIKHIVETRGNTRSVIITEGLHVLYREEVRKILDLRVFIDVDMEVCRLRRIERDIRERGRTREGVIQQFEKTVRPMFERYVLPTMMYADVLIDGEAPIEQSSARLLSYIEREL